MVASSSRAFVAIVFLSRRSLMIRDLRSSKDVDNRINPV